MTPEGQACSCDRCRAGVEHDAIDYGKSGQTPLCPAARNNDGQHTVLAVTRQGTLRYECPRCSTEFVAAPSWRYGTSTTTEETP